MARSRQRASTRKRVNRDAHNIGSGVYSIAVDLQGAQLPLPVHLTAPLVYVAEMIASVVCRQHEWPDGVHPVVAQYLMSGLNEFTVALFEGFDVEHFEAWAAAKAAQDGDVPSG